MLTLAVETAGETCGVALADLSGVLYDVSFRHNRQLLERLPAVVEDVFRSCGVGWPDVGRIAAGLGPGSFTGVRVAVTFAKTWAWAAGVPVAGVSSLEAAALDWGRVAPVVGIAPCRAGHAIVWLGGDDYRVLPVEEIETTVRALHPTGTVVLVGDSASTVPAADGLVIQPGGATATQVALWAISELASERFGSPETLLPLYVAPPPIRNAGGNP